MQKLNFCGGGEGGWWKTTVPAGETSKYEGSHPHRVLPVLDYFLDSIKKILINVYNV